jgi:hypothetical protein
VWVPHLSESIHFISAKTKSNIPWIIREVILIAKVEMFPLPTISRMSDLSIPLSLDMPKKELSIHRIGEHKLQVVNDRLVPHHRGRKFSLFRPLTILIWRSGVLPLSSFPLIIAPWTLLFEFKPHR